MVSSTASFNTRQFALLLCSLAILNEKSQAFAPPHRSVSFPRGTPLAVGGSEKLGGRWQLPFLEETEEVVTKESHSVEPTFSLPTFFASDNDEDSKAAMGDLVEQMEEGAEDANNYGPILGAAALATLAVGATVSGVVPISEISGMVEQFFQDPTAALEQVTDLVASMGPLGPLYFGLMYTIAEVLAIPAVPLTASAGYLFGVGTGTLVVLVSASIAASISFVIGRTLLRTTVENMMDNYPQFAKMDKAIGREGFKLILLLRLSPLFPFALSNYLYGATSIDFTSFFWGTLFGFAPGTLAYVYTGVVGKALTIGGDSAQPWYVYAGGAALLGGLLKLLVDVAGNIVAEIEEEADMEA